MPPFTITPATESDVPAILDMIRELAEFEHLAHEVHTDPDGLRAALFCERRWRGRCSRAWTMRWRVMPFTIAPSRPSWGCPGSILEDLYVRPAFRQKGVGRGLLEAVGPSECRPGRGPL